MTVSLFEFLVLARVAGFGVMVYGVWLSVTRRHLGNQLQSGDVS